MLIPATTTWVLVADARSARIFEFEELGKPWRLRDNIAEDGTTGPGTGPADQTAGFGPKASIHKGALHGHGELVRKEVDERRFAHTLAHVLERGLVEKSFDRLALVATPKLLGDLRENLSRGLQAKVVTELHKDYAHAPLEELMALVRPALPPV